MKVCLLLLGFISVGGLAVHPVSAQYFPTRAKVAAKPAHPAPPPSLASRHGSIGGPVTKIGGIAGSTSKAAGINGTGKSQKH